MTINKTGLKAECEVRKEDVTKRTGTIRGSSGVFRNHRQVSGGKGWGLVLIQRVFVGWDRGGMVVWPKEFEGGLLQ